MPAPTIIHMTDLPSTLASGIWKNAMDGSVLAKLSGAEPQKFGKTQYMTLTERPRAEFLGAGENKSNSGGAFGTKTVAPVKAQVTMRFDEEVQWQDEDYQMGILRTLADEGALALSRALDFGAIHGVSPLQGTRYAGITEYANMTTNRVELGTATTAQGGLEGDYQAAYGLLMSKGFTPNGIAFDPQAAFSLANTRDQNGNLRYPGMGLGANVSDYRGIRAASSTTVSGTPEIADTKLRALIADFNSFRWGVQKNIGLRTFTQGDPDGQGDLARKNQIAIRLEIVYGMAWIDLNAVVAVEDKTP